MVTVKVPEGQKTGLDRTFKHHILPQWFRVLEELALDECVMPHDIRTRWNSTYDMLDSAYTYKDAVMNITAIRDMKL